MTLVNFSVSSSVTGSSPYRLNYTIAIEQGASDFQVAEPPAPQTQQPPTLVWKAAASKALADERANYPFRPYMTLTIDALAFELDDSDPVYLVEGGSQVLSLTAPAYRPAK